jgi:hypothetical protein
MAARQRMSVVASTGCLVVLCANLLNAFPESDVVLRSGEKIEVSLDNRLDSRSFHVRDKVDAVLLRDEVREGTVALPAGTKLKGRVDAVEREDRRHNKRARLRLVFDEIVLPDGRVLPMKAFFERTGPEFSPNRGGLGPPARTITVLATGTLGLLGALIGFPINGLKGAGAGAAVGGGIGVILGLAMLAVHWDDIDIYRGQKVLIQLNRNLIVHVTAAAKP